MLVVRRATVTDVLRPLRDLGLIDYARGQISILDRAGLEARLRVLPNHCQRTCLAAIDSHQRRVAKSQPQLSSQARVMALVAERFSWWVAARISINSRQKTACLLFGIRSA